MLDKIYKTKMVPEHLGPNFFFKILQKQFELRKMSPTSPQNDNVKYFRREIGLKSGSKDSTRR